MTTKYIVVVGNPSDGYDHVGPFDTHEDANEYMEKRNLDDDPAWVIHLQSPTGRDDEEELERIGEEMRRSMRNDRQT